MANKDGWPILPRQHPVGGGHIGFEAGERVLDDADPKALRGQPVVDAAPPRAIGEGAVDDDDVADR